jgi:hypothetical protein
MSLSYISQQYTIYFGFFLLVAGVIGNSINVLIFSTVRTYRTTPCTFYFLFVSIDNIAFLTINLISRIVTTGYGIDLTQTSLVWCKARSYLLAVLSFISFTFACLPAIDQFLVTSRSAYLRSLSNIKRAHRIVLLIIIVCFLYGVPYYTYMDIIPIMQTCVNTNNAFAIYRLIQSVSLTFLIPVFIMIVFGYLTYRNIHQSRVLAEQRVDRQLTRMTLLQVISVIISHAPSGINSTYALITSGISKDPDRVLRESFATSIIGLLSYIHFVVCLPIYYRITLKDLFCLGNFLHIFDFIKSISSNNTRPNIFLAQTKSNCSSPTA